jgi:hypothetical protein
VIHQDIAGGEGRGGGLSPPVSDQTRVAAMTTRMTPAREVWHRSRAMWLTGVVWRGVDGGRSPGIADLLA